MRSCRAFVLVVLFSVAAPAWAEQSSVLAERWYSVLLGDEPAGWTRFVSTHEDQTLRTHHQTRIEVRRGGAVMTMTIEQDFVEKHDGTPISASSRLGIGAGVMEQSLVFGPEGIDVTARQGGASQTRRVPLPAEPWLAPAAAARYVQQQVQAGAKRITYRTIDPSSGATPQVITVTPIGPENLEVMGKVVPALLCEETSSALPNVTLRTYVDAEGYPLKSLLPVPGMPMTIVASDRELALAKVSPPEMLATTLIKPDKPIAGARSLRRAVYLLDFSGDGPVPELPDSPVQRVARAGGRALRVTVDLDAVVEEQAQPDEAFLAASPALNHADEKVRDLLAQALGDAPVAGSAERAEKLRLLVGQYIQRKDLSVGLATASEVARTRQGDCTEHAMLLAALLRAAGIPSRTVSGLIYIDRFLGREGVFGYHMWTQAWVDGRWVDLDATLPRAFDAAHIALGTSAMSDAAMVNDLVLMMPVFGRLSVGVVE